MSVFTNPASSSKEQGKEYTAAVVGLVGDEEPLTILTTTETQLREAIRGLSKDQLAQPEAPGKWSINHVLRHLADSEIVWGWRLRMVLAHDRPAITGYDQDAWVAAQHYGASAWSDLVDLWAGYNRHLLHVMSHMPDEQRYRERSGHSLDVIAFRELAPDAPATLDYLMSDYVVHLEHHLTRVLGDGWAFSGVTVAPPSGRKVLETERLELRELNAGDLPFVAEMVGGRVHVAWMGADQAEPKAAGGKTPMLYARLADAGVANREPAFEP